jgi:hypothetical protein
MNTDDLLRVLLRERPAPVAAETVTAFLAGLGDALSKADTPVERAILGGARSDRMGFAFAMGYQAALSALVPGLEPGKIASFCVSEEGGNRPRSILTRLESRGSETVLVGSKRWSTMAPLADTLVVVARRGEGEDGRPMLVAVKVRVDAPGLSIVEMPPAPFVPEVPHAELTFEGVVVAPGDVLPGDAYDYYVKPFRTVEDLHVQAALLGYVTSVAFRHGFPEGVRERLVALVTTARALAELDARRAETHVALSGFLSLVGAVLVDTDAHWGLVGDTERERWYRDVTLVSVAQRARTERRARAFESIERKVEDEAQRSARLG